SLCTSIPRRSRESISTRSILFPRLHSGLRLMREAHYGWWPSRTIPPAGKRQKRSRWFLSARRRGFTFCPSPQSLSWFLCRPRSIPVSRFPTFPARPAGYIFPWHIFEHKLALVVCHSVEWVFSHHHPAAHPGVEIAIHSKNLRLFEHE